MFIANVPQGSLENLGYESSNVITGGEEKAPLMTLLYNSSKEGLYSQIPQDCFCKEEVKNAIILDNEHCALVITNGCIQIFADSTEKVSFPQEAPLWVDQNVTCKECYPVLYQGSINLAASASVRHAFKDIVKPLFKEGYVHKGPIEMGWVKKDGVLLVYKFNIANNVCTLGAYCKSPEFNRAQKKSIIGTFKDLGLSWKNNVHKLIPQNNLAKDFY